MDLDIEELTPKGLLNPKRFWIVLVTISEVAKATFFVCMDLIYAIPWRSHYFTCHCITRQK